MGLALSLTGLLWGVVFPLNKPLWSSSYVLWTSGLAFLTFALCYTLIEIKQWQAWTQPFILFGRHALLVYMLHIVGLKIQFSILVHSAQERLIPLTHYITHTLFGDLSSYNASAAYAVTYTLFWLFILKLLVFCKPSI
jgi:predicted acyltransferase